MPRTNYKTTSLANGGATPAIRVASRKKVALHNFLQVLSFFLVSSCVNKIATVYVPPYPKHYHDSIDSIEIARYLTTNPTFDATIFLKNNQVIPFGLASLHDTTFLGTDGLVKDFPAIQKTKTGLWYKVVYDSAVIANDSVRINMARDTLFPGKHVKISDSTSTDTITYRLYLTNNANPHQPVDTVTQAVLSPLSGSLYGLQQGLPLVHKGSRIILVLPSSLGFQDKQITVNKGTYNVPPNSVLVFDIVLRGVTPFSPKTPLPAGY